jgi:hypothetical protein
MKKYYLKPRSGFLNDDNGVGGWIGWVFIAFHRGRLSKEQDNRVIP